MQVPLIVTDVLFFALHRGVKYCAVAHSVYINYSGTLMVTISGGYFKEKRKEKKIME